MTKRRDDRSGAPSGGRCFRSRTSSSLTSTTAVTIFRVCFRTEKGAEGRRRGYLNTTSLFRRLAGDCKAGAVMGLMLAREREREGSSTLTGRDSKAEGESLKVFGWLSPISDRVEGCSAQTGEGRGQQFQFYSSPLHCRHVGDYRLPTIARTIPDSDMISTCLNGQVRSSRVRQTVCPNRRRTGTSAGCIDGQTRNRSRCGRHGAICACQLSWFTPHVLIELAGLVEQSFMGLLTTLRGGLPPRRCR